MRYTVCRLIFSTGIRAANSTGATYCCRIDYPNVWYFVGIFVIML